MRLIVVSDRLDLFLGECLDDPVVHQPRRVDDSRDLVVGEHLGQRGAVGDVTLDDGHVRVRLDGGTVAAEQDQSTYPGREVAGDGCAEPTGRPGDQYRVVGANARVGRGRRGTYQPWRVSDAVADPQLWLARGQA